MTKKQIQSTYHSIKNLQQVTEKLLKSKNLQPAFRITLFQLHKDINAALSFWEHAEDSYRKSKLPLKSKKLQIGGGKHYLTDFVNLDIFAPADIIWDCRYGLPFPKEQFNFVFSEHFFEHLDFPISTKKVLEEIYRVLETDGELLIGVPDGGKVVKAYSQKNMRFLNELRDHCYSNRNPAVEIHGDIDLVNYLFRDQLDNPKYTVHYWAYDEISLVNLLRLIGFRKVEKSKFEARYCNPKRKFYTLYVKATK